MTIKFKNISVDIAKDRDFIAKFAGDSSVVPSFVVMLHERHYHFHMHEEVDKWSCILQNEHAVTLATIDTGNMLNVCSDFMGVEVAPNTIILSDQYVNAVFQCDNRKLRQINVCVFRGKPDPDEEAATPEEYFASGKEE